MPTPPWFCAAEMFSILTLFADWMSTPYVVMLSMAGESCRVTPVTADGVVAPTPTRTPAPPLMSVSRPRSMVSVCGRTSTQTAMSAGVEAVPDRSVTETSDRWCMPLPIRTAVLLDATPFQRRLRRV